MAPMTQQLRIRCGIAIDSLEAIQLSTTLWQLVPTNRTKPSLTLAFRILQLPPLRRRPTLIELQPLQNVPPNLKQPFPILLGDLSNTRAEFCE